MTIIRSRLYSVASVYNRLIICTNHNPGLVDSKYSWLQPTAEFQYTLIIHGFRRRGSWDNLRQAKQSQSSTASLSSYFSMIVDEEPQQQTSTDLHATPTYNINPYYQHQITASLLGLLCFVRLMATPPMQQAFATLLLQGALQVNSPVNHYFVLFFCLRTKARHFVVGRRSTFQGTSSGGPFLNARGRQCDPLFAEFKRLLLSVLATKRHERWRTLLVLATEDGNQHYILRRSENASVTTDSPARNAERRFVNSESETRLHTRHRTRAFSTTAL